MNLPEPECESGYTKEQIKGIVNDYDDFCEWMRGQTQMICEGQAYDHDEEEHYETCGGVSHGVVTYPWDLEHYLK